MMCTITTIITKHTSHHLAIFLTDNLPYNATTRYFAPFYRCKCPLFMKSAPFYDVAGALAPKPYETLKLLN